MHILLDIPISSYSFPMSFNIRNVYYVWLFCGLKIWIYVLLLCVVLVRLQERKFACFSVNIDLDINAWSWQNFPQLVHYLNNPSSDSQTKYECE